MLRKNLLSKKGLVVLAMVLFLGTICFASMSTVIAGTVCEGDFDTDGDVDGSDLAVFAGDFGKTDCDSSGVYYTKAEVDSMVADLQSQIDALKALLAGVTRTGSEIIFSGVNVKIVNGTGTTNGTPNGLGNLIVGYDEDRSTGSDKSGSHNIVVGSYHNYSSYGGLVAGYNNEVSGVYSSVSGGAFNTASGGDCSVSGGCNNTASGPCSFVGGGGGVFPEDGNEAFASYSAILGGFKNVTGDVASNDHSIGQDSTVSGGNGNIASGKYASISGGGAGRAKELSSSVCGGWQNVADGAYSSILGGRLNTASYDLSTVSGGAANTASGLYATVSGGTRNTASGEASAVSGGCNNIASGESSFVGGGGSDNVDYGNEAFADFSAILGGYYNITGYKPSNNHSIGLWSTVSGGKNNLASGSYSSISGGSGNTADGDFSSVSGGYNNTASSSNSSVSGGYDNEASSSYSSVSGGCNNTAIDMYSSVSGGSGNTAGGDFSSVSGGSGNTASGKFSSISGGNENTASGRNSSVSGGYTRSVSSDYNWRAGDLFQDN